MPSIFDFIGSSRSIYLFDTVNPYSTESIIKDLLRMNQEGDEPISMFINSPGGRVVDMFALIDVMNAIDAPINTFVLGQAASAASLIAANGDKRLISTNSSMMIHEAATKMVFDTRDTDSFKVLEEVKVLNDKVNGLYSKATGKSEEEIKELLSKKDDIKLTAQEAIAFGLVDEIMTQDQLNQIKLSEQFKTKRLSEAFHLEDSDNELKRVHLLKVCDLKNKGVVITESMLKGAKDNFDANTRGIDISIDYTHDNDTGEKPAAAWLKTLELSEDKQDLYGMAKFTPKGEEMAKSKEYKYFSIDLSPLYEDEDGKMHSNVLMGGTLTNRPAVKGLDPIKLSENINNNKIEMELTTEEITSIESVKSEMKIDIKDIHASMTALTTSNATLEAEKVELAANYSKLELEAKEAKDSLIKMAKDKIDADKLSAVESLIEKGIIVNSQKEKNLSQFSTKSDIEEFYKDVPALISVEPKGVDMKDVTIDDELKEVARQSGLSLEDVKKYGKK